MRFRTRAIHAGGQIDPQTGAVVPPLHVASTFVQPGAGQWGEYDYSRSGNPTRKVFENTLADLEGGCGALAFSSGMAAIHSVTMLLSAGDRIVAGTDIYGGTYRLLHKIVKRAGIEIELVALDDPERLKAALRKPAQLVWLESPGNPLLTITDIAECARIAKGCGALVGVDNTFATPVLTLPLELGVDIVMHSATKYIGGHSDLIGGALVVGDQDLFDRLYFIQNATGAVLGPLESFLSSRGLKTLELRVREHCRGAERLAKFLDEHRQVRRVHYPGLTSHPGHEIAGRQMDGGYGAMLSFEIEGDLDAARKVCETTELFQLAVSLGAVESLIEQPALMSHASYDREDRLAHGITDGLIRLSVGLEDPDDLIDDLSRALDAAAP